MRHYDFSRLAFIFAMTAVMAVACSDEELDPLRPDVVADASNDASVDETDAGSAGDTGETPTDAGDSGGGAPADDAGADSGIDAGNDSGTSGDDAGTDFDPILICRNCDDMTPAYADKIDCDYDGLSNAEEGLLGTDPCNPDSDQDGLKDQAELQAGTNPLNADSDADGADDGLEIELRLNPRNPDSLGDGILDGDRWVVNACDEDYAATVEPTEADVYTPSRGRLQLALPKQFAFTELTDPLAPADDSANVFSDTTTEVAGFFYSYDATNLNSAPDLEIDKVNFPPASTLMRRTVDGIIQTWDRHSAVRGKWQVRTSSPVSTRQFRDQMLNQTAPGFTGLPVASGATYTEFQVHLTAIHREESDLDQYVIAAAVAPLDAYSTREKVAFRMDDLTNSTNIARSVDGVESRCRAQNLLGERPKIDFYWVLDDSGSMEDYFQTMVTTAEDFFTELQNTNLDYRLGVTSTDPVVDGRLRPIPGWHTDQATFTGEIYDYVCPNANCIGGQEYGLENAQLGIEYMYASTTPQSVRFRPDADVITIVMTDEDAQSVKYAGGFNSMTGQALINQYINFFVGQSIPLYAIYNDGTCPGIGDNGESYRQVASASGGGTALLCGTDLTATIEEILIAAAGRVGVLQLSQAPISASLNVFKNGQFVPRSQVDGWDYFPGSNSIAFFGSARPRVVQPGQRGDDIVVAYSHFVDRSK